MAAPVTLVDEQGRLYTTDGPLYVSLPRDLMTDGGDGPNRRLRVDDGQTGFFAGREFRAYHEFTANTVFKVVVPINVILWDLSILLSAGQARLETVVGGTEGGSFSVPVPVFPRNTMTERQTPLYTNQVAISSGGTHTGGTVLDILVNKTADNSNFSASAGSEGGDERGIGPGTYYFRLTVTGTTSGIIKARWEERP